MKLIASASQHTPKMTLTVITIKVTRFRTLSTPCGRIGERVVNSSTCIVRCIQGLEGYPQDPEFERNIMRDSGKRKICVVDGIWTPPWKRDSPKLGFSGEIFYRWTHPGVPATARSGHLASRDGL